MIERDHKLSIGKQASLLGISRGSVYYRPRPVSDADLALMRRIDELHLDYPFAGSRMLTGLRRQEGHEAGRLHVSTLMKKMGIEAIYRILHRGAGRGDGAIRQAGDHEYRPGQPVHVHRVHQDAEGCRDRDQHGRQGRMARQCLCRAALAHHPNKRKSICAPMHRSPRRGRRSAGT